MKKIYISLTTVLCLCMSSISVFAENLTPRAMAIPCPECSFGVAIVTTTRTYAHNETFPCTHYSHGVDYYAVYEEVYKESCDSCGYSFTGPKNTDHVFVRCAGYN